MRDEKTNLKLLADDALADRIRFYRDRNDSERYQIAMNERARRRLGHRAGATHPGDKPWN